MTQGTITKTGNSYAIRVPISYIKKNHLKLGDTVVVDDPLTKQRRALDALYEQARKKGPIKGITDPVKWQRQQRKVSDPWEEVKSDIA